MRVYAAHTEVLEHATTPRLAALRTEVNHGAAAVGHDEVALRDAGRRQLHPQLQQPRLRLDAAPGDERGVGGGGGGGGGGGPVCARMRMWIGYGVRGKRGQDGWIDAATQNLRMCRQALPGAAEEREGGRMVHDGRQCGAAATARLLATGCARSGRGWRCEDVVIDRLDVSRSIDRVVLLKCLEGSIN